MLTNLKFQKIKLAQGKYVLVDKEDFNWLNKFKWYLHSEGYAFTYVNKKTIYMHRLILKLEKRYLLVDHINMNGLDNRKTNLRVATFSQNSSHRKLLKNNKSGYTGVYWQKKNNKWRAFIKVNNKCIHLGMFDNLKKAVEKYNEAAKFYHGEFIGG